MKFAFRWNDDAQLFIVTAQEGKSPSEIVARGLDGEIFSLWRTKALMACVT